MLNYVRAQGLEAKHRVDMVKLAHDLESTRLALAAVTSIKDEKESALSIVQQDFDRALEQAVGCISLLLEFVSNG